MAHPAIRDIFATTMLIHTVRTDSSMAKAKPLMVQDIPPETKAHDVIQIYESTAKDMRGFVQENGEGDEFGIFDKFYQSVVSPQFTTTYVDVNRNEESVESLTLTAQKIAAGLMSVRDIINPDIAMPAFMVQLHHHIPRDADGLPLIIPFDKDPTEAENVLVSGAKNTSNGSLMSTSRSPTTKQQTHLQNAANTQYIAHLLKSKNAMVPIYPNDISVKNESLSKKGKGRRIFMIESSPINQLMQIFYGQILDSQHAIPLSTFFNGLSCERGIGRYVLARQLSGQGIDIIELEQRIGELLNEGHSIEDISDALNRIILFGTNDYTNFEFYHNIAAVFIDHFSTSYYYAPIPSLETLYYKTMGYLAESILILEFHVGDGEVMRGAAGIMASGQTRTLLGNTGRGKAYTVIGYFIMEKQGTLPVKETEKELFGNYAINQGKQGDDSSGAFRAFLTKYVVTLFRTIHNELRVKLKPEILNMISNHNFTNTNIMTNKACDFLKYNIIYDPETMKLQYSRCYQSFLLRMLNSNSVEIAPEKMLQIARSHALSAGGCQTAYMHAERLYNKSLAYLKKNNLLVQSVVDRDLFLDGMTTSIELHADGQMEENDQAKFNMKHAADISADEIPVGVVSFPTETEIAQTVDVDEHLIYRLQQNDVNYAWYRLPHPMTLEFFLKQSNE